MQKEYYTEDKMENFSVGALDNISDLSHLNSVSWFNAKWAN